jgi:enoyl-CoA hydratase/carnithine racemase
VDASTRAWLTDLLTTLRTDAELRVLVLAGAGDSFCIGNDITELAGLKRRGAYKLFDEWMQMTAAVRALPAAVIAQVSGYALGGGLELALSCDLRIASENAKLGCTAINFGLVFGSYSLSRCLPEHVAKELIFTGREVGGREALALGLVNAAVRDEELETATTRVALQIAGKPKRAVEHAKSLAARAQELGRAEHEAFQRLAFGELAETAEHADAVCRFLSRSARDESSPHREHAGETALPIDPGTRR